MRRRSRTAQDTLADASAYASELIGAMRTLQAFTNEKLAGARFGSAVERAYAAALHSTRARAVLTAIVIFLVFASVVVILWVGAQDVLARPHDGRHARASSCSTRCSRPARSGKLSEVWGEISQAAGAAERLAELLAIEPAIKPPARPVPLPAPPRGEVAFDDGALRLSDAPGGAGARRRFVRACAPARRSRSSARRAPARARSSTCCCASTTRSSGAITFDGVRLDDADPRELRSRIALVPQDVAIFAASIADNIRFGRPDASDAEVARAAELAAATEFIRRLPQGFDTQIGERGVTLSGGQRQRIAIARAILRDAPLLLLDEATSSLDAESETLVQAALERLMQGRTTLVIAHRLATVLSCDRILVMDQGRIVEEGTHDSLAAAGGLYARLAKLQFGA